MDKRKDGAAHLEPRLVLRCFIQERAKGEKRCRRRGIESLLNWPSQALLAYLPNAVLALCTCSGGQNALRAWSSNHQKRHKQHKAQGGNRGGMEEQKEMRAEVAAPPPANTISHESLGS